VAGSSLSNPFDIRDSALRNACLEINAKPPIR
jgi:hypothetical protein